MNQQNMTTHTQKQAKGAKIKSKKELIIDQQYADDISWATTDAKLKEKIKQEVPQILRDQNLIVNDDKTDDYEINRNSEQEWKSANQWAPYWEMMRI